MPVTRSFYWTYARINIYRRSFVTRSFHLICASKMIGVSNKRRIIVEFCRAKNQGMRAESEFFNTYFTAFYLGRTSVHKLCNTLEFFFHFHVGLQYGFELWFENANFIPMCVFQQRTRVTLGAHQTEWWKQSSKATTKHIPNWRRTFANSLFRD